MPSTDNPMVQKQQPEGNMWLFGSDVVGLALDELGGDTERHAGHPWDDFGSSDPTTAVGAPNAVANHRKSKKRSSSLGGGKKRNGDASQDPSPQPPPTGSDTGLPPGEYQSIELDGFPSNGEDMTDSHVSGTDLDVNGGTIGSVTGKKKKKKQRSRGTLRSAPSGLNDDDDGADERATTGAYGTAVSVSRLGGQYESLVSFHNESGDVSVATQATQRGKKRRDVSGCDLPATCESPAEELVSNRSNSRQQQGKATSRHKCVALGLGDASSFTTDTDGGSSALGMLSSSSMNTALLEESLLTGCGKRCDANGASLNGGGGGRKPKANHVSGATSVTSRKSSRHERVATDSGAEESSGYAPLGPLPPLLAQAQVSKDTSTPVPSNGTYTTVWTAATSSVSLQDALPPITQPPPSPRSRKWMASLDA